MLTDKYTVEGHSFSTSLEYRAALRDQELIKKLKAKTDMEDAEDVAKLYASLQNNTIQFETVIGREFDDDIFGLVQKLKEGKNSKNTGSKKRITLDDLSDDLKAEVLHQLKLKELRRRVIIGVMSILAIVSFSYFVFDYYISQRQKSISENLSSLVGDENNGKKKDIVINKTPKNTETPDILEKYAVLYSKNNTLIGWLKIENTIIDYPVMQTVDNEYYLNHNFEQDTDKNGTLFLDYQCDVINRNTNLIIYGHRMQSGKMFGTLESYKDKSYYMEHPVINFDSIYEEGSYEVMYVFRSKIFNEEDIVFKYYQFQDANSKEEFDSYMKEMEELSLYDTEVTASYGDELLTLSTCDYEEADGRFVVVAKRVK